MFDCWPEIVIGLGGNLPFQGSPTATTLKRAIILLADDDLVIRAVSRFFSTPCFPAGAGPDYVNAAVAVETTLGPDQLLGRLHRVEATLQRERAQRWGMRTLDADLLAYGQTVMPDEAQQTRWRLLPPEDQIRAVPDRLILPHPRLQDRAFALIPMADVAPGWVHPLLNRSVTRMCSDLSMADREAVRAL